MDEKQSSAHPDAGATPAAAAAQAADDATRQAEADAASDSFGAARSETEAGAAGADEALAQAQAKIAELSEKLLRALADTANIQRRAQDDVAKAHKFAIESFAEYLLPVADSLEAALSDTSADANKVREGAELTLRQLQAALKKGRVVELGTIGEKFDPHRHQAISLVPADQEPNTVVAVLQKGYLIADRVLRPALVTVAQPKAAE